MSEEKNTSPRFDFNKKDGLHILKVFLWSISSAAVGFIILVLPQLHVPEQYALIAAAIIPTVNTALVAAKKFIDDHGKL